MATDESTYQQLSAGQAENFRGKSFAWRLAVVGSAVCGCFFNAGVVFGYSAIFPELVAHGAFRDKCQDETDHEPCSAQVQALTGMFTLATSMLNVLSIVSGALLDRAGPRWTAGGAALCVAAGALLFSTGGPGKWEMGYRAGFLLLGVSGPVVFVSSLSFANLFPGREGLCTAALVGCFDASSAVFVGLSWLIKSGVSFETTFRGYALLPACTALVALLLWPRGPVRTPSVRISSSSAGGDGCSLSALPLGKQARSIEYFLLVQTISIGMVCINFFIATCDLQMLRVDTGTASALGQAFAAMLPLGGIVYIPLVGYVVDNKGPTVGLMVLWASLATFFVLNGVYAATAAAPAAYAAFAVFAWCRPLFYTLGAAFTGQVFGFATFGMLYGLLNTLAGLANCLVQPLQILADSYGFDTANAVLFAVQLTIVALPLVVFWKDRKRVARKRSDRTSSGELSAVHVRSRAHSVTGADL